MVYHDDNSGSNDDELFCGVTDQRRSFSLISKFGPWKEVPLIGNLDQSFFEGFSANGKR